jgi:hAT family C-terminal dimerisation region
MSDLHIDTTDEDDDLDDEKPIEDLHVMNENVENDTSSEDEDSDRSKNNSNKEDVSDSEAVISETILDDSSSQLVRDMCDDLSGEYVGKCNRRIELKDISDDKLFASVLRVAWVLFRKHYNRTNALHICSIVLDPRYNYKYFKDISGNTGEMKNEVETAIVEVSKMFTNTSQSIIAIPDRFEYSDDDDPETVNDVCLPVRVSSITRGSSIICHSDATHNSTQSVSSLLTQGNNDSKLLEYMKRRPVSRSMSLFFCWTKLQNGVTPNTYNMALLSLLIPATSFAVERLFSLAGQMVTPH